MAHYVLAKINLSYAPDFLEYLFSAGILMTIIFKHVFMITDYPSYMSKAYIYLSLRKLWLAWQSYSLTTVKRHLSSPILSGHPPLNGHLSNSQKAVPLFTVNLTSIIKRTRSSFRIHEVNYSQLSRKRPPLLHYKVVAYGKNQQNKPKLNGVWKTRIANSTNSGNSGEQPQIVANS